MTLSVEANDRDLALRQTVLHIAFDGHPAAQVQSPVDDFFGCAPGLTPYDSAPFTVRPDGTMECRYLMPFKKHAQIAFQNLGDQEVRAFGSEPVALKKGSVDIILRSQADTPAEKPSVWLQRID